MYIDSNIFIYAAMDNTKMGHRARNIIKMLGEGKVKGFYIAISDR